MNTQNHKKKKKREDEIEEDIILDENGMPVGLPIEKVKDLTPRLYEELTQEKSVFKIDEVKNEYQDDDELNQDDGYINEVETNDDFEDDNISSEIKVVTKTKYENDYLEGFEPTAIDFIRRAKTVKEAIEIIDYLEKRKELELNQATELRTKLEQNGLESFGSHKKHGYYFQVAQENRLKEKMKLIKRKESNSKLNNS